MIIANSISLSFGKQKVFDDISFDIKDTQKLGLIGRNGSGKSTLLEAIIGMQPLDEGSISVAKNKKIAYLPQEVVLASSSTVLEETMTAFAEMADIHTKLLALEKRLETHHEAEDLEEYALLHEQLKNFNPESAKAEAKKMLLGLGFKEADFSKSVQELSLGWRMRIVLAKLLLQKADFYLFDEPTNHLDIFAKDWFMDFLSSAPFGFMLVCHERYFLDALCKQILELEMGKATVYQGNFSTYEVQKAHAQALLESAYQLQQKEIKQKEDTINRFKASAARAKQAQSMMKQLDKIERIVLAPTIRKMSMQFPPLSRSGKTVLKIDQLAFSYGVKELFSNISFEVERGQKVAIVASNGVGKSTLFNLVAGRLTPTHGTIEYGQNVHFSLFDQDQNSALDLEKTVLENIEEGCPSGTTTALIRGSLGSFLFGADEVKKKVKVLSGGEKNRVGMVRVLLQKSNLLLLDEPTNHLDIDSKQILIDSLKKYEGTIIFVSHDRAFLNDLATRIVELTPTGVIAFEGNYDQFLYYKKQLAKEHTDPLVTNTNTQQDATPQKNTYELVKKGKALERKLYQLEQKKRSCQTKFGLLTYGTPEYTKAEQDLHTLQEQIDGCMAEWEAIQALIAA